MADNVMGASETIKKVKTREEILNETIKKSMGTGSTPAVESKQTIASPADTAPKVDETAWQELVRKGKEAAARKAAGN